MGNLTVRNLTVTVDNKKILESIDFNLGTGEIVALMGPNGSGKTTLAKSIMGYPNYRFDKDSLIEINGENLVPDSIAERSRKGLFLGFQHPVEITGVNVQELIIAAIRAREKKNLVKLDVIIAEIKERASVLKINKELLDRDINYQFSGGEKKKIEILQMFVLKPKFAILDEIDSGLDVDSLKLLVQVVKQEVARNELGILFITHYPDVLNYLLPDRVLVMNNGKIVEKGNLDVVKRIASEGYNFSENNDQAA